MKTKVTKKKTVRLKSFTLDQLNKLVESDDHIVLIRCDGLTLTLSEFSQLEVGEDYLTQEEINEGFSGINAYVWDNGYRYPLETIDDVFVASKVKIK